MAQALQRGLPPQLAVVSPESLAQGRANNQFLFAVADAAATPIRVPEATGDSDKEKTIVYIEFIEGTSWTLQDIDGQAILPASSKERNWTNAPLKMSRGFIIPAGTNVICKGFIVHQ